MKYVLSKSIKSFARNGLFTVASIIILSLTLFLTSVLGMLMYNVYVNLEDLDALNEIVCVCEYDLSTEDAIKIEDRIKELDNVESVQFVSKEDALAQMREKYEQYPEIMQMYDEENNPLPHTYKIKYTSVDDVSTLKLELNKIDEFKSVDDRVDLAKTIDNLKNMIFAISAGVLALLLFVSIIIIMYTIRMAISARQKEIVGMRYVGATNLLISAPFTMESLYIAIISSALAYMASFGLYQFLFNRVSLNSVITIVPFDKIWYIVLGGILLLAVLTCYHGSKFALHKYVKV